METIVAGFLLFSGVVSLFAGAFEAAPPPEDEEFSSEMNAITDVCSDSYSRIGKKNLAGSAVYHWAYNTGFGPDFNG